MAGRGPVETACIVVYLGHFVVPLALGAFLALSDRAREFKLLMFGILTVSVLGAITFVIAPSAPPWLAAEQGHLADVHHLLKLGLRDLHMDSLAALEGDATKYDVTAAVPSLHAAFPFICLSRGMAGEAPERGVLALLAANLLAVLFAIVYLGEHYVVDAVVGLTYAAVSVVVVGVLNRGEGGPTASRGCTRANRWARATFDSGSPSTARVQPEL